MTKPTVLCGGAPGVACAQRYQAAWLVGPQRSPVCGLHLHAVAKRLAHLPVVSITAVR